MATATKAAYSVVALEEIEPGPEHDGRVPRNIRRHFDIRGFGVRANRAVGDGHVIGEHDEAGLGSSGQEELYLVVSGAATFNVNGERIEAPADTFVFVRDPAAKRSAVAKEEGGPATTRRRSRSSSPCSRSGPRRSSTSTSPAWRLAWVERTTRSGIWSRRSRTMIGSRRTSAPTRT